MAEQNNMKDNTEELCISTAEKIKILIDRQPNVTPAQLSRLMNYSRQSISTKIKKDTLKTSELDKIADMLGYEVTFVKKKA